MVVVAVAVDEADVLRTTAEEDEGANATAEPMRVERTASFMLVLLMIGEMLVPATNVEMKSFTSTADCT
jgi:hypothetical protein